MAELELKRNQDVEKDKFLRCMVDVIVMGLDYDLKEGLAAQQYKKTGELVGTYLPERVIWLIRHHGYYTVKSLVSVLMERSDQLEEEKEDDAEN